MKTFIKEAAETTIRTATREESIDATYSTTLDVVGKTTTGAIQGAIWDAIFQVGLDTEWNPTWRTILDANENFH